MSAAELKKAAAITCLACGGEYKHWEEQVRGIYAARYCRWCEKGRMNLLQAQRWNEKANDPYARKSSGIMPKTTPTHLVAPTVTPTPPSNRLTPERKISSPSLRLDIKLPKASSE